MRLVNKSSLSAPNAFGMGALLSVQGISKSFGGVIALSDVSFNIKAGKVAALIGPNGAGKTTLFNCITGFLSPDEGSVTFADKRLERSSPHRVARAGMVRTFQSIRMFSGLTVYESLLTSHARLGRSSRAELRERASDVMVRMDLVGLANRICTDLPLLAQRKVEVARALMAQPLAILLDEPSAGATTGERGQLAELVLALSASGTTVLVIEHNVPFVMEVSDQVVVLDFGKVVADGTAEEIAINPIVQEIYLG